MSDLMALQCRAASQALRGAADQLEANPQWEPVAFLRDLAAELYDTPGGGA